jgi:hypothetical protein
MQNTKPAEASTVVTKRVSKKKESFCRACKKTGESTKIYTFVTCESWIQEIFETIGGFAVSLMDFFSFFDSFVTSKNFHIRFSTKLQKGTK